MAVKFNNKLDDGYPTCHTHDGIDTDRANKTGWKDNALVVEQPVDRWTNSKTGEPMEKPDYA